MKTFLILIALVFSLTGAVAAYSPPILERDNAYLNTIFVAKTSKDRALIPSLIKILQLNPLPHPSVTVGAAEVLAGLGATEALPAFDSVISNNKALLDVQQELRAFKAHLIAVSTPGGARAQTQAYLASLGMKASEINEGVAQYNSGSRDANAYLSLFGMGELAEVIYHSVSYSDFANLPEIRDIKFDANEYSGIEFRLAALPRDKRLAAIMDDLASGHQISFGEHDLAAEFGTLASEAAAAKLMEIDKDREHHRPQQFASLMYVIAKVDDKMRKSLIDRFTRDANPEIAASAARYSRGM